MILAIIEMNARPAKQKELLQTLHAIIQQIRNLKGCMKCSACQDIENKNILRLIEQWTTQQDIDNHLRSDLFSVLLGAKNLMCEPLKVEFNRISSTTGMEAA
jgi:quinol monooxygenase YgiN